MQGIEPPFALAERYEVVERIGSGGMASVWRAHDTVLGRDVAVKFLHEHLARDPGFVERFRREALSAARLTHPNIVNVFDTGELDGVPYIVMELFTGGDLSDLLERHGPLEPDEAVDLGMQVLAALRTAHGEGVVHRDVKPGNILVQTGPETRVKVADFGIAKAAYLSGDEVTSTGRVLGSVPYLSPEQVQGEPVDARSDLYALGVVLYEALTGRRPFEGDNDIATAMLRVTTDPLPPRAVRPGISRPLEAVVQRAMARRPDDRYASADEMAAALGRIAADRTTRIPVVAAVEETGPEPEPARSFFRSWMLVPLLVLLIGGAVIAIGLVVGFLEVGGPLGVHPADDGGASNGGAVEVAEASAIDPFGSGGENDGQPGLAVDGDEATAWTTESYDANAAGTTGLRVAAKGIDKAGVGLVLELDDAVDVGAITLTTTDPGWTFELRVGDDLDALGSEEPLGQAFTVDETTGTYTLDEAVNGRYVVIWVTSVVTLEGGGGNRAVVAEAGVQAA
jgi:serine/threonine-protein kinase